MVRGERCVFLEGAWRPARAHVRGFLFSPLCPPAFRTLCILGIAISAQRGLLPRRVSLLPSPSSALLNIYYELIRLLSNPYFFLFFCSRARVSLSLCFFVFISRFSLMQNSYSDNRMSRGMLSRLLRFSASLSASGSRLCARLLRELVPQRPQHIYNIPIRRCVLSCNSFSPSFSFCSQALPFSPSFPWCSFVSFAFARLFRPTRHLLFSLLLRRGLPHLGSSSSSTVPFVLCSVTGVIPTVVAFFLLDRLYPRVCFRFVAFATFLRLLSLVHSLALFLAIPRSLFAPFSFTREIMATAMSTLQK